MATKYLKFVLYHQTRIHRHISNEISRQLGLSKRIPIQLMKIKFKIKTSITNTSIFEPFHVVYALDMHICFLPFLFQIGGVRFVLHMLNCQSVQPTPLTKMKFKIKTSNTNTITVKSCYVGYTFDTCILCFVSFSFLNLVSWLVVPMSTLPCLVQHLQYSYRHSFPVHKVNLRQLQNTLILSSYLLLACEIIFSIHLICSI